MKYLLRFHGSNCSAIRVNVTLICKLPALFCVSVGFYIGQWVIVMLLSYDTIPSDRKKKT